jgi:hypothetical protein
MAVTMMMTTVENRVAIVLHRLTCPEIEKVRTAPQQFPLWVMVRVLKLKYENVPKWDGNVDTIVRWMLKINDIARESEVVFQQLGRVVPKRLEGAAEVWYWSLPVNYRSEVEKNWDTLRQAFATYFLNRK